MNPIFQGNSMMQMINDIRNGKVDAKSEVMRRVATMSPAQKDKLRYWMPTLKKIANQNGIPDSDFESVIAQLK